MKIAWFTPLGETRALSGYSVAMCEALSESCEVEVHALDPPPWRASTLPIRDAGRDGVVGEDAVRIYAVGGDQSSREMLARGTTWSPGVCVLHHPVDMSLLFESELVVRALGLVVHSDDQRVGIEQRWFGPVGCIQRPVAERPDTARHAAAELLDFLERAAAWRPGLVLVDRVATELGAMGLHGSSPAVDAIAREVAVLATP